MVAMVLFGCKETPYINEPGDNKYNYDSIPVVALPDPDADPVGFEIPAGCLNVYEAVDSCRRLPNGGTTQEKHYVKGWVRSFDSKHESGVKDYGNGSFYIAATKDGSSDAKMFEAYQVYELRISTHLRTRSLTRRKTRRRSLRIRKEQMYRQER